MRKILISSAFIVFFAGYVGYQYALGSASNDLVAQAGNSPVQTVSSQTQTSTGNSTPPPTGTQAQTQTRTQTRQTAGSQQVATTQKSQGQYANGTYTGSTVNAYYGLVQVQVKISGGKLADVQFLQYPNDRQTSMYINSQAMPLLRQEAIAAQSAQIDGVSGATETSMAFQQSLAAALSQARG